RLHGQPACRRNQPVEFCFFLGLYGLSRFAVNRSKRAPETLAIFGPVAVGASSELRGAHWSLPKSSPARAIRIDVPSFGAVSIDCQFMTSPRRPAGAGLRALRDSRTDHHRSPRLPSTPEQENVSQFRLRPPRSAA